MTQTAKQLLDWARAELFPILNDGAATDARILLAHVMGLDRGQLSTRLQDAVTDEQVTHFKEVIAQRAKRQPVSQIIGSREFWGRRFSVTPDVLDPRPDTETLIEEALKDREHKNILDLGTGSGCILLTLLAEWPNALGVGVDQSSKALAVATSNAIALGVAERAYFMQSDWFSNVTGQFDLIVSNPPYITARAMDEIEPDVRDWEPRMALTPEGDGLDAYRTIAAKVARYLTSDGRLFLEIGWDQADAVLEIFSQSGFNQGRCIRDLAGKDRILAFNAP